MSSPQNKKWDKHWKLIKEDMMKVHGRREPHVALMLAIMLQAAIDKDFKYLNENNHLFQLHCKLGAVVPKAVIAYMRTI